MSGEFETGIARLEEILTKMNSGGVSLDDSLKLYEEADTLIGKLGVKLNLAEKKIEQLMKKRDGTIEEDKTGNALLEPLLVNDGNTT